MKRLKKIKTKMALGIFFVFLISFSVFMINLGANQGIVQKSQSLLKDNYPSAKYTFSMLAILDELNISILSRSFRNQDSLNINTNLTLEDSVLISSFKSKLKLQENNITEPGEKELTGLLKNAFTKYETSISEKEYLINKSAFITKYENLRAYILSIHDLNVKLLESKNEQIKNEATVILNIQEKVGIAGLTILCILIIILPLIIINPIDRLTTKMIIFYKKNFNQDIDIKSNNELDKLEKVFEEIVLEYKKHV